MSGPASRNRFPSVDVAASATDGATMRAADIMQPRTTMCYTCVRADLRAEIEGFPPSGTVRPGTVGFGRPWTRRSGGGRYWVFSTGGHTPLTASISGYRTATARVLAPDSAVVTRDRGLRLTCRTPPRTATPPAHLPQGAIREHLTHPTAASGGAIGYGSSPPATVIVTLMSGPTAATAPPDEPARPAAGGSRSGPRRPASGLPARAHPKDLPVTLIAGADPAAPTLARRRCPYLAR